jgi:hypothetical protein
MRKKKLEAKFYRTQARNVQCLDWINDQSRDDQRLIGEAIRTVEETWPVPPPLVKKLDAHMWEIRETISNRNEARLIFIVDSGFCVLLHGFEKSLGKRRNKTWRRPIVGGRTIIDRRSWQPWRLKRTILRSEI